MKRFELSLVSLLAVACGDFAESVRVRAANDFRCPASQIALSDAEPYAQPKAYLAEGCGKSGAYEGGCDLRGCLVERVPSAADRAERAALVRARREKTSEGSTPAEHSAPPASISVTIRNECPKTVKVFYGEDPRFSGGTLSTLGGNSISNHTFRPGDVIWLVDDARNGLSSVNVNEGMRRIKITKSCTGFSPDR